MPEQDGGKDKTTQAQLGETQAQLGETQGGKGTSNASSGLQPGQAHPSSAATVTGGGAPASK